MKILLTGFEPFGNLDSNSSWEVTSKIACHYFEEHTVCVEQLPVSFNRAGDVLSNAIQAHRPDFVLMLGQSGGAEKIKLERVALNMMDAKKADNDGFMPSELPIDKDGENVYFTNAHIKEILEELEKEEIPSMISNSCGLYVCNCTYYKALSYCIDKGIKCLFVHLPYYDGQNGIPEGKAMLDLNIMVKAIEIIIKTI
jgi:pyroglutamyl-peptidase